MTPERRQYDVTFLLGFPHGKDSFDASSAARSCRAGVRHGRLSGPDCQCFHRSGGQKLGRLSRSQGGRIFAFRRSSGGYVEAWLCASTGGRLAVRQQGSTQSALPVRQRQEVQALPRAGLKCDTRPTLTADRVPRLQQQPGLCPTGVSHESYTSRSVPFLH
jgi:hypothetical protein